MILPQLPLAAPPVKAHHAARRRSRHASSLRALGLAFGLFGSLLTTAVQATTQEEVLAAQILPGWQTGKGRQMVALQLDLAPGWKTYWRSPGEGGIPPQFDWSGSSNLRAVTLHWPSPSVFVSSGMHSIGYHDQLVLPLELVAIDPSKPIVLQAEVMLGICRDICMPAQLTLNMAVAPQSGPKNPLITNALATGAISASKAGLTTVSCQVAPIKDGLRLTARLELPPRRGIELLAVELDDPSIWISEAETSREGNTLTAVTDLVPTDGKPFALNRSMLRLTLISDAQAVEVQGCPG